MPNGNEVEGGMDVDADGLPGGMAAELAGQIAFGVEVD